jgi:hypothetical protein
MKLDADEKELVESVERGEWNSKFAPDSRCSSDQGAAPRGARNVPELDGALTRPVRSN